MRIRNEATKSGRRAILRAIIAVVEGGLLYGIRNSFSFSFFAAVRCERGSMACICLVLFLRRKGFKPRLLVSFFSANANIAGSLFQAIFTRSALLNAVTHTAEQRIFFRGFQPAGYAALTSYSLSLVSYISLSKRRLTRVSVFALH